MSGGEGGGAREGSGDEETVGAEIRIEGTVQGVGFRQFAQYRANRLGIVGYAMNLPDGSVRVVAEGAREALEAFTAELKRGPRFGRVERLHIRWCEARGEFAGFGIRYHGPDA